MPDSTDLVCGIGNSRCSRRGRATSPGCRLQIGVMGDGGSDTTGSDGKARIRLAKETKAKTWVSLQIITSPKGQDVVFVQPWDDRTLIPPFENESENFVRVVVVQRGDRAALENGSLMVAAAAQINKANAPRATDRDHRADEATRNLAAAANRYGLTPDELDGQVRAWGEKTTDPYEAGLAALYERNYPKAVAQLADSLRLREANLATDQRSVAETALLFRSGAI